MEAERQSTAAHTGQASSNAENYSTSLLRVSRLDPAARFTTSSPITSPPYRQELTLSKKVSLALSSSAHQLPHRSSRRRASHIERTTAMYPSHHNSPHHPGAPNLQQANGHADYGVPPPGMQHYTPSMQQNMLPAPPRQQHQPVQPQRLSVSSQRGDRIYTYESRLGTMVL